MDGRRLTHLASMHQGPSLSLNTETGAHHLSYNNNSIIWCLRVYLIMKPTVRQRTSLTPRVGLS